MFSFGAPPIVLKLLSFSQLTCRLASVSRNSSRVLAPPGGRSNFSFGSENMQPEAAVRSARQPAGGASQISF
eukprot:1191080-Prorocentrum_minimum.AAC.5